MVQMFRKLLYILILFLFTDCLDEKKQSEIILRHYIDNKVELLRNYSKKSSLALWNASISGDQQDYQKLIDLELDFNKSNKSTADLFLPDRFSSFSQNVFTKEEDFQLLKKLKKSGLITDTLLNRQLTVLYYIFMGPQFELGRYKKLIDAELKLSQIYSNSKIVVNGKKYSLNLIDSIRKNNSDPLISSKIFRAFSEHSKLVSNDIVRLVKLRNEFAANFGYANYHQLAFEIKEQSQDKIKILLDEIEFKTRDQFFKAKSEVDKSLAKRFKIPVSELRSWHYNEKLASYIPAITSSSIDSLFLNTDPIVKASEFFDGIGLPVQDIIENSDLKYRPEKSAATYMFNIDFKSDLRLLSNIQNNMIGMQRMMHLCGHASHYKAIPENIPYLLKTPNSVIAEGIASFFERMTADYNWLKYEIDLNPEKARQEFLIQQQIWIIDRLFRCRKLLVLAEFERQIYSDSDQNLSNLWYELNQKYLGIHPPEEVCEADWAYNNYITSLSCTIQNSLLAEVFAAQLKNTIEKKSLHDANSNYQNNLDFGLFMISNLYKYGNVVPWEQLIEKATGEKLNSSYFINSLVVD